MNNDTHHHEHSHITNEGKLGFALVLTLVYMVAEVVGGLIFHSLALLADSGHMLSDAMALGLSWLAIRVGRKSPATVILLDSGERKSLPLFSMVWPCGA